MERLSNCVSLGIRDEDVPKGTEVLPELHVGEHAKVFNLSITLIHTGAMLGLNLLQYKDGWHIMNVNRDDAAGFCLDTMVTHRLHRTPMVQGQQALTTYTDYVNRYPSLLQTTSYLQWYPDYS